VDREGELELLVGEEPAAEVVSFHGRIGSMGDPRKVAEEAWDLDAVAARYQSFIARFGRARASSPEACFRAQTEIVHEWRRFPFLDPDLPEDLLARKWPRRRAHELFVERHERWALGAQEYFDKIEESVVDSSLAAR
jgi:phenylacetic acid degradation operon negative regulatory protein